MKCPYCQREMKSGFVPNYDIPVQWIPQGRKGPSIRGQVGKDGIRVGDGGYWRGYKAEAYYCGVCRIIIIPNTQ